MLINSDNIDILIKKLKEKLDKTYYSGGFDAREFESGYEAGRDSVIEFVIEELKKL